MNDRIRCLFDKMKSGNCFWSYSGEIRPEDVGEEILVETVLKYGDVEDILLLFDCFDGKRLYDIWVKRLLFDRRFDRLNFYLAKVFFDVDPDAVRRDMSKYDRKNKLEKLASRD